MASWCRGAPAGLVGQPLAGATLPPALQAALLQLLEVADTTPCEVFLPQASQWLALTVARQAGSWVFYGQDITAQKQAPPPPAPVAGTSNQYHALLQAMDQGFCVLEVAFDEAGHRATNFRYLELNPVFARQWGLPPDAQGRTARALRPGLEPFWLDTYGRVASTGAPVRVEHYVPAVGRWFEVHALRVAPPEARQWRY